jgi:hypothetical protein
MKIGRDAQCDEKSIEIERNKSERWNEKIAGGQEGGRKRRNWEKMVIYIVVYGYYYNMPNLVQFHVPMMHKV